MIFGDHKPRSLHWAEAFGASAVVHLGAAILMFDLLDGLITFAPEVVPEPEIEIITLLDDSFVAAPDQPETNDPLSETPTEPDTPDSEPVVADDPPDDPAPPPEEDPEPVDPAEELQPVPADIAELEPERLAPLAPDAGQTVITPQPISPLRPEDGTAIPVAPVASTAAVVSSATQPGTTLSATPVTRLSPTAPTSIAPLQTLPTPPPTPATAQAPTPDGQTAGGVVSELINRIRGRLTDPCLLAIPQQSADGVPELVLMGSDEAQMQGFVSAVLADLVPRPTDRQILIDARQCAALNFARENRFYPAFRLSVSLDQASIESGTNLTGAIGNTAGRYISLLLVDDNGVVQDVGNYLSFTGSAARFDVLLTRDGNARDTSQTLVALATATRPSTLNTQNGQLAADFFAALRSELGPDTPLVLVPFEVR